MSRVVSPSNLRASVDRSRPRCRVGGEATSASHSPMRRWILVLATAATVSTVGALAAQPSTATGRVVDVHGRPVAGAAVEVSIMGQDYRRHTLGQGVSDVDGRFALSLAPNESGASLGIGVDAPGFVDEWVSFPRGIVDETIVLRRVVDQAFLEALRSVRDPQERARRVMEIAASEPAFLPEIEEMFPYLGEVRSELAAIVLAGIAERKEQRTDGSPADHASRLLAYWADPADDAIVLPWIKENWGDRP